MKPHKNHAKSASEHPPREHLLAFSSGALSGAELAHVARHLKNCDVCCQSLRDMPEDAFVAKLRDVGMPTSDFESVHRPIGNGHEALPKELLEHPRYKIGRFLGAGGMGAVYLAEHRMMGRAVALKIIHRRLTSNPRVIERFRQEVKAAAKLSHPNIVAAYDAEQAGDAHFLVMEFVDGMSLDRVVASKGQIDVANACNFIRQAGRGLQHAFEAGMVHRDIKPHNLMLTRKGQVKILDFGLARLASETRVPMTMSKQNGRSDLTRFGEIVGTPDYMAPEQISSPHDADIRADIYSLGCTLYFLLAGEPPFADGSAMQVLHAQQHRVPQSLGDWRDDVPAGLDATVKKMLAKQPVDRYQTPSDVVIAITPFIHTPAPVATIAVKQTTATKGPPSPSARDQAHVFEARCPFCTASIRLPDKAMGVSIPCPHCSCYFTAVSMDAVR